MRIILLSDQEIHFSLAQSTSTEIYSSEIVTVVWSQRFTGFWQIKRKHLGSFGKGEIIVCIWQKSPSWTSANDMSHTFLDLFE